MAKNTPALHLTDEDKRFLAENLPELQTLAQVNVNYDEVNLTVSAERELAELLYREDGVRRKEKSIIARIEAMRVRIRSRINQILEGTRVQDADTEGPRNPNWKHARKGDPLAKFKAGTRTKEKRYSELWSNENDLKANAREAQHLIFDPEYITDNVLKALDLRQYIAPKGTPKPRRLELAAQAIPVIKYMLRELRPIPNFDLSTGDATGPETLSDELTPDKFNHRMYRIHGGANDGKLFVTHRTSHGDMTFQVMDLPAANRRLIHIDAQYKVNDLTVLAQLPALLKTLYGFAQEEDWAEMKRNPMLGETLKELDRLLELLLRVDNKHKRSIRDAVLALKGGKKAPTKERTLELLDSLINGPFFRDRAEEIERISAYHTRDDEVIEMAESTQQKLYTDFKTFVETHFREGTSHIAPQHVRALRTAITTHQAKFKAATLQPYSSFGKLIATYFEDALEELVLIEQALGGNDTQTGEARKTPSRIERTVKATRRAVALDDGRSDGADTLATPHQHLASAYVAAKAEHITSQLLQACEDIALITDFGNRFSFEPLEERIAVAQQLLAERRVDKKYYPREFNPLWVKFKRMVDQVAQQIEIAKASEDQETRNIYLEQTKENIKAFVENDVMRNINILAAFRKAASTDEEGNPYVDLAVCDLEWDCNDGKQHIPPVLVPKSRKAATPKQQEAAAALLGNEPHTLQFAGMVMRIGFDRKTSRIKPEREPRKSLSLYVKPPCSITPDSTKIHGITDAMVANARPISECLETDIIPFFVGVHGIVGHGVTGDLAQLTIENARACGMADATALSSLELPAWLPKNTYCTMIGSRDEVGKADPFTGLFKMPSLAEATEKMLGRAPSKAHDAAADTLDTANVFLALLRSGSMRVGVPTRVLGK